MNAPALFVNVVTPFAADGSVDAEALRRLLRRLVESRIGALLTNGGPGEGHSLTLPEFRLVYDVALEECGGRIPVQAVIPEQHSAAATIERARIAEEAGVDAVQIALIEGPHLMKPTREELAAYFDRIAGAIARPLMMAINHGFGYVPTPAAIAEICRRHGHIVGMRFGNVPDTYVLELRELLDRPVSMQVLVSGSLNLVAAGVDSLHGIEANIIPRTLRRYADALGAGDLAASAVAYGELRRLDAYGKSWSRHAAKWLKMAVKALNLPGAEGGAREPYLLPGPDEMARFAKGLRDLRIAEIDALAGAA